MTRNKAQKLACIVVAAGLCSAQVKLSNFRFRESAQSSETGRCFFPGRVLAPTCATLRFTSCEHGAAFTKSRHQNNFTIGVV